MVGELFMLPMRVGMRATQLWFRVAEETASVAANTTGRLIGIAMRGAGGQDESDVSFATRPSEREESRGQHDDFERDEPSTELDDAPPDVSPVDHARSAVRSPAAPPPPVRESPRGETSEPGHVSEEPTLVDEFAEPGAEDGAGAEIRIEEPWEGYAEMNAKQVIERLNSATPAELAAVQLYEGSHRHRQTIVKAVQRALRAANGSSVQNEQRG
jgi:hypothetical protein